jgi:hypothetical protein
MESELNPYAPGSGLRPPAMAGRDSEINSFDLMVARNKRHLHNRGMVLSGLRGVGKTVLLNSLRSHADKMGWLTVGLEGRPGGPAAEAIREKLARELLLGARKFVRRPAAELLREAFRSVSSFSATLGISGVEFGFEKATGRADSGRLDIDLEEMIEDLSEALKSERSAFAIFIDEMQDLDPELLAALITVQHSAGQREWPFYIIGAGLPNLPGKLSEARSYAERLFDYRQIGPLDEASSMRALEEPAVKFGARFHPQALQTLLHAAGGYPYFIQEFGKAIWDIAPEPLFTADDAELAVAAGRAQLDAGFFPSRWERATKAERRYLLHMAEDGDTGSGTTAVANRMGTTVNALGPARSGLIGKGLIYAPEHGRVAFTVPGMADFIRRQYEQER